MKELHKLFDELDSILSDNMHSDRVSFLYELFLGAGFCVSILVPKEFLLKSIDLMYKKNTFFWDIVNRKEDMELSEIVQLLRDLMMKDEINVQ